MNNNRSTLRPAFFTPRQPFKERIVHLASLALGEACFADNSQSRVEQIFSSNFHARRHFDLNKFLAVVTWAGEFMEPFALPANSGFVNQLAEPFVAFGHL